MKSSKLLILALLLIILPIVNATSFGYNYLDKQPSGNITNEYINNTYINQTVNATVNTTQFDSNNPIHIKTSWLTSFIEGISKWANYWTKTENINATGYNISADYFIGNGSQLTGIPTPDLSGYFKLDQSTPQTIINGTPKFTKSLIAAKTITDTSLIESFTFGDQAAIFQANSYSDYGVIFSAVGDHQYPLYNSFLKSRSTNGITRKAVKTGDQLGLIEFVGDTGTYYVGGAEIRAEVIATPGTNTMPTDLIFGTNFNKSIIPERWRLTSIGDWVPKADNQHIYFGAAKDASITYNGTNLIINPKEVGSGYLSVLGDIDAGANTIRTTGDVQGKTLTDGVCSITDGGLNYGCNIAGLGGIIDDYDDGIDTVITFVDGLAIGIATAYDSRLMTDITYLNAVDTNKYLTPVTFKWSADGLKQYPNRTALTKNGTMKGYLAQDVLKFYPECIVYETKTLTKTPTEYMTYDRNCVSAMQSIEVANLKENIISIENRLTKLEKELAKLNYLVGV